MMINNVFIRSILANFHSCRNNHPSKVSIYRQYFIEINFQVFDFTNGFKCNDMHNYEKLNKLSIKIFELNFCQDQNKWIHKLIPVEKGKNNETESFNKLPEINH